jgi:activator of 2-hydroxyglutaryl-CoA dehydratase/predicted nucleotide-binding protein (sugar kinase/HSP70/actin superfamily)
MTVKAVVLDGKNILFKDYRRHNGRQAETVRQILERISGIFPQGMRIAITGSGGRALSALLGAPFIQEVNAVTLAVESLIGGAGSAVELGGQDAKVIIWRGDGKTTLSYMNDKCAGGTGATIDKIAAKIGLSPREIGRINGTDRPVHRIAAKCGVFAETDVVGLLKAGIGREEIFLSLCHAMVKQNLEVLVHGSALPEKVVLLGGPNTFIPAFAPIWREQIKSAWEIHGYTPREDPGRSIIVPPDAQFFAALGAVFFAGQAGEETGAPPLDPALLDPYIAGERNARLPEREGKEPAHEDTAAKLPAKLRSDAPEESVLPPLARSPEEIEEFRKNYGVPDFEPPAFSPGDFPAVYIGVDGGSTSTKIALTDPSGKLLYRDYLLSRGNPLEDIQFLFTRLGAWRDREGIRLRILGAAATGYARDILKSALELDLAVVETVAHMRSAAELYGDVDVICDVGGQDIKVLFMKNRRVVDFKLNTQCSAGNGFFLQNMANQFNIPVEEYADHAFRARRAPRFNYGCAVFMEQDRVNFQQAGWTKEEMMSGLVQVLPLNIWNYVVQESNLSRLGRRFVLQGGTQKNLAAVKAQVDFIRRKVPGSEIFVHRYADLGGAIGAALEVRDHTAGAGGTSFIGIDAAAALSYASRNDETTRCGGCANRCRRTFVDIASPAGESRRRIRFISGYLCERGALESAAERSARPAADGREAEDLSAEAARLAFSDFAFRPPPETGDPCGRESFYPPESRGRHSRRFRKAPFAGSGRAGAEKRSRMTVGIPRLLNLFYYAPLFSTYFRTLGLRVVFSDLTNDRLWSEGNTWGVIDPCFPAKVAPAHIWQLLHIPDLSAICFPIITGLESTVIHTLGSAACVIQMGTPEVVEAVFTRERDRFAEKNIAWWDPSLSLDRPAAACDQLYRYFADPLAVSPDENAWAFHQGLLAMGEYLGRQRERFTAIMNRLIDEDRVGLLLIGHPYHHDPGLNHRIPGEFQKRGYPVFTIESLPVDDAFLDPLFPEGGSRDIRDVWVRNFNRNTNQKIWAAKVASRHPNLAVIDLSSFKCGHDAPTYSYIDQILDHSGTPHFSFHDIDQNRPGASFKIRIDTIDYFLKEYEEILRGEALKNGKRP